MPGHRSAPGGRKCAMIPRRPHATAPPIYSSGVPDPGGPPERRDSRGPPNLGPFAGAARLRGQPGRGRFAAGPHRRLQPPAGPRLSAAGRDGARDKLPPSCLRGPLWVASHGACWAAWQRFGKKKNGPATQGTLQVGRAEAPQRLPLCHAQRPAPAAQPIFQVPAPNITAGRRKATETRPGRGRLAQGYCGMLADGRWRWRAGSLECRAPAPSQSGPRGGGAGGEAGTRDCWKRRPPSPRMDPLTAGESQ